MSMECAKGFVWLQIRSSSTYSTINTVKKKLERKIARQENNEKATFLLIPYGLDLAGKTEELAENCALFQITMRCR